MEKMTVKQALAKFEGYPWYDNHRLDMMQACHRKAFYHLVGPYNVPLAMNVGDAANFGTVWHAAMAQYYDRYISQLPYNNRLVKATIGFNAEWQRVFTNNMSLENRYKLGRGVQQLVLYCDKFRAEDEFYRVIASELGFAILVKPRGHEKFNPFVFKGRIDRVLFRETMKDIIVGETKTCSGDPNNRLKEMHLDRQTQGYFKALKEMEAGKVGGVLLDAVQISATKITDDIFARDYVALTEADGETWRMETIGIVRQWEELLGQARALSAANAGNAAILANFDRRTKECTHYGLCQFYDLCLYGVTSDTMSKFRPDVWNPLSDESEVEVMEA